MENVNTFGIEQPCLYVGEQDLELAVSERDMRLWSRRTKQAEPITTEDTYCHVPDAEQVHSLVETMQSLGESRLTWSASDQQTAASARAPLDRLEKLAKFGFYAHVCTAGPSNTDGCKTDSVNEPFLCVWNSLGSAMVSTLASKRKSSVVSLTLSRRTDGRARICRFVPNIPSGDGALVVYGCDVSQLSAAFHCEVFGSFVIPCTVDIANKMPPCCFVRIGDVCAVSITEMSKQVKDMLSDLNANTFVPRGALILPRTSVQTEKIHVYTKAYAASCGIEIPEKEYVCERCRLTMDNTAKRCKMLAESRVETHLDDDFVEVAARDKQWQSDTISVEQWVIGRTGSLLKDEDIGSVVDTFGTFSDDVAKSRRHRVRRSAQDATIEHHQGNMHDTAALVMLGNSGTWTDDSLLSLVAFNAAHHPVAYAIAITAGSIRTILHIAISSLNEQEMSSIMKAMGQAIRSNPFTSSATFIPYLPISPYYYALSITSGYEVYMSSITDGCTEKHPWPLGDGRILALWMKGWSSPNRFGLVHGYMVDEKKQILLHGVATTSAAHLYLEHDTCTMDEYEIDPCGGKCAAFTDEPCQNVASSYEEIWDLPCAECTNIIEHDDLIALLNMWDAKNTNMHYDRSWDKVAETASKTKWIGPAHAKMAVKHSNTALAVIVGVVTGLVDERIPESCNYVVVDNVIDLILTHWTSDRVKGDLSPRRITRLVSFISILLDYCCSDTFSSGSDSRGFVHDTKIPALCTKLAFILIDVCMASPCVRQFAGKKHCCCTENVSRCIREIARVVRAGSHVKSDSLESSMHAIDEFAFCTYVSPDKRASTALCAAFVADVAATSYTDHMPSSVDTVQCLIVSAPIYIKCLIYAKSRMMSYKDPSFDNALVQVVDDAKSTLSFINTLYHMLCETGEHNCVVAKESEDVHTTEVSSISTLRTLAHTIHAECTKLVGEIST